MTDGVHRIRPHRSPVESAFGTEVMLARLDRGLTQVELAELLQCSAPLIQRVEMGYRRAALVADLVDFAEALWLRPEELFRRVMRRYRHEQGC